MLDNYAWVDSVQLLGEVTVRQSGGSKRWVRTRLRVTR